MTIDFISTSIKLIRKILYGLLFKHLIIGLVFLQKKLDNYTIISSSLVEIPR